MRWEHINPERLMVENREGLLCPFFSLKMRLPFFVMGEAFLFKMKHPCFLGPLGEGRLNSQHWKVE